MLFFHFWPIFLPSKCWLLHLALPNLAHQHWEGRKTAKCPNSSDWGCSCPRAKERHQGLLGIARAKHTMLYVDHDFCMSYSIDFSTKKMVKGIYKITKIVRALWLAERRVCMRVCKHVCDIKMFCFWPANHASTNLKKVLSWKPQQVYFIHPFPHRLKLGKSLETCCVNSFSLELTF